MSKNVGGIDQKIRFILGVILFGIGVLLQLAAPWRIAILAVATILLITSFTGL